MPRGDRAKIFAPFAALKGHDGEIAARERILSSGFVLSEEYSAEIDTAIRTIREKLEHGVRPAVSLTAFLPENHTDIGEYVSMSGSVRQIDVPNHILYLDGRAVPIDCICGIEIRRTDFSI